MASLSQNGWPVASVDEIHYYRVPGSPLTGTVAVRKGAVAVVMLDLMEQLQKIEPAVFPGLWGWYVRPIRGQTTGYSNHSSGTAIDWNAPLHPRQYTDRYRGWSAQNVAWIHKLLSGRYQGVLRWGADFHDKPYDPMHFEVIGTVAQVNALAAKLLTPVPAPPPVVKPAVKDEVMFVVSLKSQAAQYLSNGLERRWIPSSTYKKLLVDAGVITEDVLEFDSVKGMNAMAGPEKVDPVIGTADNPA